MRHKNNRIIDIVPLVAFIAVIVFLTIKYAPYITELARKPDEFRDVILSYGYFGVIVFISIQVFQVIVAAIPGELIQIAGGFVYGAWLGTLYLSIGVVIGTLAAFYAARLFGYSLIKKIVAEDKLARFKDMMESKKADLVISVLFLLPGLPKDFLVYVGGLTPVKPMKFIIITTIARLPALFFSAYIGENIQEQDYVRALIISIIAVVLFLLGVINRERIFKRINR